MKSIDEIIEERKKIVKKSVCYLNEKDEVVTEEEGVKVIITEYDENDNIINEIFGTIEKKENVIKEEEER